MVRRLLITIPALVGLLAALSCNALNLLRFHGPASVLASHEFDVVVAGTGSMSSAVGGQVGVVLQLPPGVTALRAAASSPQDVLSPVAMNAPGPMGVFTAEPGHSLASFSGDAGTSNQLVRLLRATLRAPDTPTTLVIKAALTRPDPNSGNWIVDGSQSNQFSLITNPDHQIQVEVVAAPDPAGTGLMWTHAQTGLDPSLIGTPQHFDVGDIDGDGRDDLAMVTTLSNVTNVITRLSRPGGAWVTSGVGLPGHVNGATSPRAALGDVDGDGLAELAKPDGTIWSRSVNGTWTIVGLAGVASSASQVFAGDFDGDGWDDFCFLESAAVRVFLSLGNGTLGFAGMMTINNVAGGLTPAAKVRIGDLDGDGDDEIFLFDGVMRFFEIQGGSVLEIFPVGATTSLDELAVGDLTGDGVPELVAVTSNIIGVHLGLGGSPPAFGVPTVSSWPVVGDLEAPQLGDVDGDGLSDLIMRVVLPNLSTTQNSDGLRRLVVLRGTVGGFSSVDIGPGEDTLALDPRPQTVIGDFNGDGLTDIVDRAGGLGPTVRTTRPLQSPVLDGTAGADTLLAGGQSGGINRVASFALSQPFTIQVLPPPGTVGPALFAVWGQLGPVSLLDLAPGPFGTGVFTAEVFRASDPRLFTLTNGLWNDSAALVPATAAPWSLTLPLGVPLPSLFALQGLIVDTGTSPLSVTITNALTVDIR